MYKSQWQPGCLFTCHMWTNMCVMNRQQVVAAGTSGWHAWVSASFHARQWLSPTRLCQNQHENKHQCEKKLLECQKHLWETFIYCQLWDLDQIHLLTRRGRGLGAAIGVLELKARLRLWRCAAVVRLLCNCSSVSNKFPHDTGVLHECKQWRLDCEIPRLRAAVQRLRHDPAWNKYSESSECFSGDAELPADKNKTLCVSVRAAHNHTITQYLRLRIKIPAARCFPAESRAETDSVRTERREWLGRVGRLIMED